MRLDVNTGLGHWPFMKFAQRTASELAAHLASEGVDRALVSSIDAVLFPEPHLCNIELAAEVSGHDRLIPLMTLDPTLSHWRDCLSQYRAAGSLNAVRLVPNYHRYTLDMACVDALAEALLEAPNPVLVVQMRVDDERNQYPLMQVPGVPTEAIIACARRWPSLPIVCLCPYRNEALQLVSETDRVYVDLSFIEFLDTLASVTERIPAERILFGSHTPFLYTRAAVMKLECATIAPADQALIAGSVAEQLFGLG